MNFFLPSYAAIIWNALKTAMVYAGGSLANNTPQSQKALVIAMADSLKFGLNAIEADLFYQASGTNFTNLAPVPTFAITVDPTVSAFMNARIDALQAAILSIQALSQMAPPQLLVLPVANIPQALLSGAAIFNDPGFLEWLILFDFETPPAGLTVGNFVAQAQAAAIAWTTIATAMQTQGILYNGSTLNAVNQMGDAAQAVADALTNLSVTVTANTNAATVSSPILSFTVVPSDLTTGALITDLTNSGSIPPGTTVISATTTTVLMSTSVTSVAAGDVILFGSPLPTGADLTVAWNTLVAAPTLTRFASLVYNNPTSLGSQNTSVIRYVILGLLREFNGLIVALRQAAITQVKLATVRQGDSLMDLAARNLGDYTQWYSIAQINALIPPFVAPASSPGIAGQGQQLFMPTGTSVTAIGDAPNYQINYLGVDIFYGPLNGEMLPWTGDFQVIAGYRNLAFSLGRRLQTTLGDLIYHLDFGSRVPPEVGAIESPSELGLLKAFTESALRTDPRVNSIIAITVNALPNYAIAVSSTVLPNGIGVAQVTVNEVLGPA